MAFIHRFQPKSHRFWHFIHRFWHFIHRFMAFSHRFTPKSHRFMAFIHRFWHKTLRFEPGIVCLHGFWTEIRENITHLLTFLILVCKLKAQLIVRVVSDNKIEYDNKSQESRRRAVIFYMTTGKPGGNDPLFTKLRCSRSGSVACELTDKISIAHFQVSDAPLWSEGWLRFLWACRSLSLSGLLLPFLAVFFLMQQCRTE